MNDFINMYDSEADTRAELIDPKLREAGWVRSDTVNVRREYPISPGRILDSHTRASKLSADYVLIYKNQILGIVEAKKSSLNYTEGIAQAKDYAQLLKVRFTYATNGHTIYQIDTETGEEKEVPVFPSPETLWDMTYTQENALWDLLSAVPYETAGRFEPRYYQNNAINAVIKAMAQGHKRILLTLATGTGKTCIAFQIIWKLFQAKWNLHEVGSRAPRVLFLADRNILANQAFNAFGAFPQDALCRIKPSDIRKEGKVPTAENIFFTIFQTFMSGPENTPYFGQYQPDFFDFIVIDECHRGGAKDESQWRDILNYFSSAVQLGLTATPKRKDNVDTYAYFGNPVYEYSLKEAINDGFLTPFRVRVIQDNMGTYEYHPEDDVEGEIDKERTYTENDFNRKISIKEREESRVRTFMGEINQNEKTLVFCATQQHAAEVRDIINRIKTASTDINYCVRVTANDGLRGEELLRQFQDTEKTIPTILTTSQKLSTGVDAIQVRNIVLMRPVNSIIEFKQIIGRGTRLCDGKAYFTVYDFVGASANFEDPEWDGPIEYTGKKTPPKPKPKPGTDGHGGDDGGEGPEPIPPAKIKLGGGREVEIVATHTSFYDASGKPISAKEFIEKLFHKLPDFFHSEEELRKIWSAPSTRKQLLDSLAAHGYTLTNFDKIKEILHAEHSDVFDVLALIAYSKDAITREERVEQHKQTVLAHVAAPQQDFIQFVLRQYISQGITELDDSRLGELIKLKYGSALDGQAKLGSLDTVRQTFCDFQKYLYL